MQSVSSTNNLHTTQQTSQAESSQGVLNQQNVSTAQSQGSHASSSNVTSLEASHAAPQEGLKSNPTAQDILDYFKGEYNSNDREMPYKIMNEITHGQINFTTKPPKLKPLQQGAFNKLNGMKITLRHYSYNPNTKGEAPPHNTVASNFQLVHEGIKHLNSGSSSNTNQKDWTHLGNTAFTFFAISFNGELGKEAPGFLGNCTHYAEIDLDSDKADNLGEIWASKDLLTETNNLGSAVALKGDAKQFKTLICAHLAKEGGFTSFNVNAQAAAEKLNSAVFKGLPEVKVPGSVEVDQWIKK